MVFEKHDLWRNHPGLNYGTTMRRHLSSACRKAMRVPPPGSPGAAGGWIQPSTRALDHDAAHPHAAASCVFFGCSCIQATGIWFPGSRWEPRLSLPTAPLSLPCLPRSLRPATRATITSTRLLARRRGPCVTSCVMSG